MHLPEASRRTYSPVYAASMGASRLMRVWALVFGFLLSSHLQAAAPVNASVQFTVTSDWGAQFDGQISITNQGADSLQDWTLEFDFSPEILLIWDAKVVSHSGTHYVIQSAGWNSQIAPKASV